jgi:hypothetical protein
LLVRKIARNSLRRVKNRKPSPPGKPPHSHAWRFEIKDGKKRATTPPLKLIYSVPYGFAGVGAMIGPVGFGDPNPVPAVHEFGLTVTRSVWPDNRPRFGSRRFAERVKKQIAYKKRPTMGPALERAAPKLPSMWRGSLGGA